MSRRPGASDEALIELFLDMLAAERGAGENTLAAYRNDLEDLSIYDLVLDSTTDAAPILADHIIGAARAAFP